MPQHRCFCLLFFHWIPAATLHGPGKREPELRLHPSELGWLPICALWDGDTLCCQHHECQGNSQGQVGGESIDGFETTLCWGDSIHVKKSCTWWCSSVVVDKSFPYFGVWILDPLYWDVMVTIIFGLDFQWSLEMWGWWGNVLCTVYIAGAMASEEQEAFYKAENFTETMCIGGMGFRQKWHF